MNWELDLWGRIRAGHAIARTEAKAVQHDLEAARLSIVAQAVRLWVQWSEALIQRRLASESVLLLEQTLLQSEVRFGAGRGRALDVHIQSSTTTSPKPYFRLQ